MRLYELYQEQLNEDFNWSSSYDEDVYRQLNSLVKNNNGLWKSPKQAAFLSGDKTPLQTREDAPELKKFFNIDLNPGEKAVNVDGYAVWARGSRGTRPVSWFFIIDKYGVVRKYKLKYVGDMKKGTSPDPNKTELQWSRPSNLDTAYLDVAPPKKPEEKPESNSEHVGEIKQRLEFTGKVLFSKPFSSHFGESIITKFATPEGNILVVFGGNWKTPPQKDEIKKFVGTVKKHDEYNGDLQTILNRVKEI